jgi:hypothetical protein
MGVDLVSVRSMIETFLPPRDRAIKLCGTFLEHLSWMFHIVSRQQLVNELIPAIYHKGSPSGPHDLALLLIVLGIACLVDLDMNPYNLEAQHYYRLARAAVTLQPVLGQQSIVTIKVVSGALTDALICLTTSSLGDTFNEHIQRHERQGKQSGAVIRVT